MIKVVNVAGARPNFVKIAPLIREMKKHHWINSELVHTGQHYDYNLSQLFFEELEISPPNAFLEVGSLERTEQIAAINLKFEAYLRKSSPDLVVLVGDVNSTLACSQAAKRLNIKVAHVEAGLRSFDTRMQEEVNRIETDKISDLLFVTEEAGMKNLAREGIAGKRFLVGNVMIDSLVYHIESIRTSGICEHLHLEKRNYVVGTFHRPSNVDTQDDLERLIEVIKEICNLVIFVVPLHPRTRHRLQQFGLMKLLEETKNLVLTEPVGYIEFLGLLYSSLAVITDSGGIQEETTFMGVPCITTRENTERPITVDLGTNILVGMDKVEIVSELGRVLAGAGKVGSVPPHWDGRTSERIVQIIKREMLTDC